MKGLIQRVSQARVEVDGLTVGEVAQGLVLFLGVEKQDNPAVGLKLLDRVLGYKVFPDTQSHMNLSLLDVGGSLLVVSQFTLAADTRKGRRPSFSAAAPPAEAEAIYDDFVSAATERCPTASGRFGADMQVHLVNDGPVTFLLEAGS